MATPPPPPCTNHAAALRTLLTTYAEMNYPVDEIEYLDQPPTPLEFLQIVSRNRPVIIRNAMNDWPAMGFEDPKKKWTVAYLKEKMGDSEVMVAETPRGNADSIVIQDNKEYFVKPHTTPHPFTPFLTTLISTARQPSPPTIYYAQSQDSNLSHEYTPLLPDIPPKIPWASIPLSQDAPDAINLWIGTHHSVSSLHKDPYQNLYGVVLGTKIFTLVNPLGVAGVKEKQVRSATYIKAATTGEFEIFPDPITGDTPGEDGYITWPSVDIDAYFEQLSEDERKVDVREIDEDDEWKWLKLAKPLRVEVKAGEMLYLPALWFHQVAQRVDEQEGVCVAVNYWYDMDFSGPFVALVNYVRDSAALVAKAEEEERERRREAEVMVGSPVNKAWCKIDCNYAWVQE